MALLTFLPPGPPFCKDITECNQGGLTRFETLNRYLDFNDNSKQPELSSPVYDKLYKIKPVIDSVLNKCRNVESEQYIAVDEQIISTKIKNFMKQYLPKNLMKGNLKYFQDVDLLKSFTSLRFTQEKLQILQLN